MERETPSYGSGATIEKLDALSRYADTYTRALKDAPRGSPDKFTLHYVDGFAGAGEVSLTSGKDEAMPVRGSARIALDIVDKPFDQLLFIDKSIQNVRALKALIDSRGDSSRANVHNDDANEAVQAFCKWLGARQQKMHRAFVFLDPFAMEVHWETIAAIAETKRCDLLMLFPLMALRRNLKRYDWPPHSHQVALQRFFGDDSWKDLYEVSGSNAVRKGGDREIVVAYGRRLQEVFFEVVDPERTLGSASDGSLFTMLFGASNKKGAEVAAPIAAGVFAVAKGIQGRMKLDD